MYEHLSLFFMPISLHKGCLLRLQYAGGQPMNCTWAFIKTNWDGTSSPPFPPPSLPLHPLCFSAYPAK